MACAKPPEPGRATPPSSLLDFAVAQGEESIAHGLDLIASGDVGPKLTAAKSAIEAAIERMQRTGATDAEIEKMRAGLKRVEGEGLAAISHQAVYGGAPQKTPGEAGVSKQRVLELAKDGLARESAGRAVTILTTPGHWAHEAFKSALFRVIEGAGKIPQEYKTALTGDAAMLLRVCPKAGGLVAAMLTRGQPQGSFMRRFQHRGNDAVGAAYEIMGTAALCRHSSPAVSQRHKARSLEIDPTRDRLVFGPKSYLNHQYNDFGKVKERGRGSVEADAQFLRREANGSFSEVAIDFKHVKEGKTVGSDEALVRQIKAVSKQIAAGVYDEFHFVTNGRFSERVQNAVDEVNELLLADEAKGTRGLRDDGVVDARHLSASATAKIVLHHHVMSIEDDPYSDGQA